MFLRYSEPLKEANRGQLPWDPVRAENGSRPEAGDGAPLDNMLNREGVSEGETYWAQVVRHLLMFQKTETGSVVGVCAAKHGESAAGVVAALGGYLNAHTEFESPVLLVEANFHRPTLAQIFGVPSAPGLRELLLASPSVQLEAICKSRRDRLWVLPAGGGNDQWRPEEFQQNVPRLFQALSARFHNMVIELPPASDGPHLQYLYRFAQTIVLAVKPNSTGVREVRAAIRSISEVNANLVGTILNDLDLLSARHRAGR